MSGIILQLMDVEIAVAKAMSVRRFEEVWVASAEARKIETRRHEKSDIPSARVFSREAHELLSADPARAEKRARQALMCDALDPEAQYLLGVALRSQGRYPESIDVLNELTRSHPQMGAAWQQLGMAQKAVGNTDAATHAFRNAIDFNPVDA